MLSLHLQFGNNLGACVTTEMKAALSLNVCECGVRYVDRRIFPLSSTFINEWLIVTPFY